MVGYFLVVEMPHARDKGRMAVLSGPVDRFFLRFDAEHVVCVILYHIASFSVRLAGGFIAFPRGQNSGVNCNPRDQLGASRLYFVPSMEVTLFRSEHGS
jgi:hypothetical protein